MASWREGGKPATMSEDVPDDRVQPMDSEQSISAEKLSTSVSAATNDLQKQAYMMASSQHYPPFHGPIPPYMAMRPGVKPPAMGPVPFHMSHMPMMPPNYTAMMMSPFVRSCSSVILYSANDILLYIYITYRDALDFSFQNPTGNGFGQIYIFKSGWISEKKYCTCWLVSYNPSRITQN